MRAQFLWVYFMPSVFATLTPTSWDSNNNGILSQGNEIYCEYEPSTRLIFADSSLRIMVNEKGTDSKVFHPSNDLNNYLSLKGNGEIIWLKKGDSNFYARLTPSVGNSVNTTIFNLSRGPYVAKVEFDKRLVVRDNSDKRIWTFPNIGSDLPSLNTYVLDNVSARSFLRMGDKLCSPSDCKQYITIDSRGYLVSKGGFKFNKFVVPNDEFNNNILVLNRTGLGLFDPIGSRIHSDYLRGDFPNDRYKLFVTDNGFLTLSNIDKVVWSIDIKENN